MRKIYLYLLVYLLLPILLVMLSLLFWRIRASRRGWGWASSRAITTIIVLFFLLHPSLTRQIFAVFHCRDIDGEARLVADLEATCYQGTHLWWAGLGGGSGLFLWVAGIPWVAFAVLRDKRHQLGNADIRQRYGFLFSGYKERAYFWESLVMLRKVAVIFVAVFLRSLGTRIQAFALFVLLLAFLGLTHQRRPFRTRRLNHLELLSLAASASTVYAGFFFLAARPRADPASTSTRTSK